MFCHCLRKLYAIAASWQQTTYDLDHLASIFSLQPVDRRWRRITHSSNLKTDKRSASYSCTSGQSGVFSSALFSVVVLRNFPVCAWAWHVCERVLVRKPPWCCHHHSEPVLLTLTSAVMWPDPEANLQDLSTDAEVQRPTEGQQESVCLGFHAARRWFWNFGKTVNLQMLNHFKSCSCT